MSVGTFLLTTHGIDLIEKPAGSVYGWRGSSMVGFTWKREPDKCWMSRRTVDPTPQTMQVPSRHVGIAYFVGACPDCVCTPGFCDLSDGDHCATVNCGYCLNGCSEDECPMVVATTGGDSRG